MDLRTASNRAAPIAALATLCAALALSRCSEPWPRFDAGDAVETVVARSPNDGDVLYARWANGQSSARIVDTRILGVPGIGIKNPGPHPILLSKDDLDPIIWLYERESRTCCVRRIPADRFGVFTDGWLTAIAATGTAIEKLWSHELTLCRPGERVELAAQWRRHRDLDGRLWISAEPGTLVSVSLGEEGQSFLILDEDLVAPRPLLDLRLDSRLRLDEEFEVHRDGKRVATITARLPDFSPPQIRIASAN